MKICTRQFVSNLAPRKVNAADIQETKNRTFRRLLRIKHGKFSEFLFPRDWINTKMTWILGYIYVVLKYGFKR